MMLRELNPNMHDAVPFNASFGVKPLQDNFFLSSPGNSASPTPLQGNVGGGTQLAIPPAVALMELESIRQRLLVLSQGISAWNALPTTCLEKDSYAADPAGRLAFAKLQENGILLDQCRVMQAFQQQLSHDRVAAPLVMGEGNETSLSFPSIFAPPQMQVPMQLPMMQPSQGSTPPSSASRGGQSPVLATTTADDVGAGVPSPSSRPSYGSSSSSHIKREMLTLGSMSTSSTQQQQLLQQMLGSPHSGIVRRVPWPPQYDCVLAVVEFKRQRVKRCITDTMVDPGKYVIIPGDRGYDCGLVVQCGRYDVATGELVRDSVLCMDDAIMDVELIKGDMIPISREATSDEIQQLYSTQASKERLALKRCRDLVQRLNLDMNVVDCEYQFDGTKISFYFEAAHSIDFRQLNKELYRIFNARIWLENVNNSVKNVVPDGAMSKTDKAQFRRSGLRLPPNY